MFRESHLGSYKMVCHGTRSRVQTKLHSFQISSGLFASDDTRNCLRGKSFFPCYHVVLYISKNASSEIINIRLPNLCPLNATDFDRRWIIFASHYPTLIKVEIAVILDICAIFFQLLGFCVVREQIREKEKLPNALETVFSVKKS